MASVARWLAFWLLSLSTSGCIARAKPVVRTERAVLRSSTETSSPKFARREIELPGAPTQAGLVRGRVDAVFECTDTVFEEIRTTRYERRPLHTSGAWVQGILGVGLGAGGGSLIAIAPNQSATPEPGDKFSPRDNMYFYGAALATAGAVLLGHLTYAWLASGESQESSLGKEQKRKPPAECERRPATGVDVAVSGASDAVKPATLTTDAKGRFELDLTKVLREPSFGSHTPELSLSAEGAKAQTLTPEGYFQRQLSERRAELHANFEQHGPACQSGKADSCIVLGRVYREGNRELGVEKNRDRALEYFARACRAGHSEGCFQQALTFYQTGDAAQAARLYQRACSLRAPGGCNNLGVMYQHGEGGLKPDPRRALALFERACAGKSELGCNNLADLRRSLSRQAAVEAFRNSVRIGSESHCGLVVEVKRPVAKVQSMIGEVWLKVSQLYPKGAADCRFVNKVYVEP